MRVVSAGNQSAYGEATQSFGQMKLGFHSVPNFHPHSLPEYHDGLTGGLPLKSSANMTTISGGINSGCSEGLDIRQMHRVSAIGHSRELNDIGNYNESLGIDFSPY